MNDFKTIKQLADELGVSKQAIRKHIDKLPVTLPVTKKGNIIYLSPEITLYIKNKVRKKSFEKNEDVTSNVTGNKDRVSSNNDEVDSNFTKKNALLEIQLDIKDKQIKEKDEQIKSLHKLLDQQQILTLQANKKIEELEMRSEEKETEQEEKNVEINRESEKKSSDSFWKKLFRKEK